MDIRDFLARHLNDHEESARGVKQATFHTWSRAHVEQAVQLALAFLYSLIPDRFGKIKEYTVEEEDCIIPFCDKCTKFLGLVDLEINGKKCIEIKEEKDNTNVLLPFLATRCADSAPEDETYSWMYVTNSNCVLKFETPLPKGAKLRYLCSETPSIEEIESEMMSEYLPMVAEYAAAWLFRTDSESRSNLERAKMHLETFGALVNTKLRIELALRDEDYIFGQSRRAQGQVSVMT